MISEYKVDHDISVPFQHGGYFEKGSVKLVVDELKKKTKSWNS